LIQKWPGAEIGRNDAEKVDAKQNGKAFQALKRKDAAVV
jgi:hypothetical protein